MERFINYVYNKVCQNFLDACEAQVFHAVCTILNEELNFRSFKQINLK